MNKLKESEWTENVAYNFLQSTILVVKMNN